MPCEQVESRVSSEEMSRRIYPTGVRQSPVELLEVGRDDGLSKFQHLRVFLVCSFRRYKRNDLFFFSRGPLHNRLLGIPSSMTHPR